MMLVQVGLSSLLVLVFIICYAYYTVKPPANMDERTTGLLLLAVTILLFYGNYAKSFYIYMWSSPLFRSIYLQRLKKIFHAISIRRGTIVSARNLSNQRETTGRIISQPNALFK